MAKRTNTEAFNSPWPAPRSSYVPSFFGLFLDRKLREEHESLGEFGFESTSVVAEISVAFCSGATEARCSISRSAAESRILWCWRTDIDVRKAASAFLAVVL